ncbi:hypothetical protein ACFLYU_02005 [Candidatus Dependentiae bacterium]
MRKRTILATFILVTYITSANASFWGSASDSIKKGAKDGDSIKNTVSDACTKYVINPLIVNPLKKILKLDKGDQIKRQMDSINNLAKTIDNLKRAGASRRKIALLSAQLSKKLDDIINRNKK